MTQQQGVRARHRPPQQARRAECVLMWRRPRADGRCALALPPTEDDLPTSALLDRQEPPRVSRGLPSHLPRGVTRPSLAYCDPVGSQLHPRGIDSVSIFNRRTPFRVAFQTLVSVTDIFLQCTLRSSGQLFNRRKHKVVCNVKLH